MGRSAWRIYPSGMTALGWATHAAILLALVVNLWFGGDVLEAWLGGARLGHVVRSAFELALIGAWLVLVVGMRVPWKRRAPDDGEGDRRP